MRRLAFACAATAALLLSALVVSLWVRSYWFEDMSFHATTSGSWYIESWRGRLTWHDSNQREGSTEWWFSQPLSGRKTDNPAFLRTWPNRLGFLYQVTARRPGAREVRDSNLGGVRLSPVLHDRYVRAPHWSVAGLLAVASGVCLRLLPRSGRVARLRRGQCPGCGYDLRGTPGRCPECGEAAAVPSRRLAAGTAGTPG